MATADGCIVGFAISMNSPASARAEFLWHVGYRYGTDTTWSLSCNNAVGYGYLTEDLGVIPPIFLSGGALNTSSTYKFPNTCVYLASGTYVSGLSSYSYVAPDSNFSFEMWTLLSTTASADVVGLNGSDAILVGTNGCYTLRVAGNTATGTVAASAVAWQHIAVSRSGGVMRLFVDGAQSAVTAYTGQQYVTEIGGKVMYVDSVGFSATYAKYTTDFAQPTRPFFVDETTQGALIDASYVFVSGEPLGTTMTLNEYDQYWDKVSLLIRGEGVDGSTNIVAEKNTKVDNYLSRVIYVGSESKYGNSSIYFNGSNSYLVAPSSWQTDFHEAEFTIELWVRPTQFVGEQTLISHWSVGANKAWRLYLNSSGRAYFGFYDTATATTNYIYTTALELNAWTFIAVTLTDSTYRIWANGVLGTTLTSTRRPQRAAANGFYTPMGEQFYLADAPIMIGADSKINAGTNPYKGYMEGVRITNTVSRYRTDDGFVPTRAFVPTGTGSEGDVYWNDVKLAVNFTEPPGAVYNVRDARGHIVSLLKGYYGQSTVQNIVYRPSSGEIQEAFVGLNGGFIYQAGTGYASKGAFSVPYGSEFDFTSGDFTIEMFVYTPVGDSAANPMFYWSSGTTPQKGIIIHSGESPEDADLTTPTGYLVYSQWSSTGVQDIVLGPSNCWFRRRWHHIAVVRKSGVVTVFVDGKGGTPTTLARYPGLAACDLYFNTPSNFTDSGAYQGANAIGATRITKAARYNGNFYPPYGRWPEMLSTFGNTVISETMTLVPGSPKSASTVDGAIVGFNCKMEIPKVVMPTFGFSEAAHTLGTAVGGEGASTAMSISEAVISTLRTSYSEVFSFGDSATIQYVAGLVDGFSVADTYALTLANVTVREQIAVSTAITARARQYATMQEAVTLAETQRPSIGAILADDTTYSGALALTRNTHVYDHLYLYDAHDMQFKLYITTSDGVEFTDSMPKEAYGGEAVDTVGYADTAERTRRVPGDITDAMTLHSVLAGGAYVTVSVTDSLGLADTLTPSQLLSMLVSDTVEFSAIMASPMFTTWVMNTRSTAVSQYDDYLFNSFVQVGERYLGATDSGLYWLDGDTDAGTPITTTIQPGVVQPHGNKLANVLYAYLGMRGDGTFTVTITDEAGGSYEYTLDADTMKTGRVTFGKGLRTRYFTFRLDSQGGDYDLDSIEFVTNELSRKVQR